MTYKFKYRRHLFWRRVKIVGHRHDPALDKMVLYFLDGGIEELSKWSACDLRLGPDWLLAAKKNMEAQAGQAIPFSKDIHAQ